MPQSFLLSSQIFCLFLSLIFCIIYNLIFFPQISRFMCARFIIIFIWLCVRELCFFIIRLLFVLCTRNMSTISVSIACVQTNSWPIEICSRLDRSSRMVTLVCSFGVSFASNLNTNLISFAQCARNSDTNWKFIRMFYQMDLIYSHGETYFREMLLKPFIVTRLLLYEEQMFFKSELIIWWKFFSVFLEKYRFLLCALNGLWSIVFFVNFLCSHS